MRNIKKEITLRKNNGQFIGRYSLSINNYRVKIESLKGVLRLAHLPIILEESGAIPEYDTFGNFLEKYSFIPEEKYRIRSSSSDNTVKFWVEHYDSELKEFVKGEPITLIVRNGGVRLERIHNCYVEDINGISLSDLALLIGDYHTPLPHDLSYTKICDVVAKVNTIYDEYNNN